MSSKALLQHSFNVSNMIMDKYLTDLKPEAFLVRPVAGMNHLAWQLGHLISTEHRMMEQAQPGASPELPEGFDAQHAKETHVSDNPGDFLSKDEYLTLWKAQRAATSAILEGMSEPDLEAVTPDEKTRQMCPTVGTMFNLMSMHALMHSGQFVAVRRQNAMPLAF